MKIAYPFLALIVASYSFFGTEISLADDAVKAPSTAAPAADAAKAESPDAQKLRTQVSELFEVSKGVNAAGDARKNARAKVETSLNWDRIAQDCLGKTQWKKQNAKNLNEFKNLLKDVITRTAYTRLDTFWKGSTYSFDKIDVKGSEANVAARFTVGGDPFVLEYFMERKGANWLIYDISFDGLRYSENINEQLQAFLREKGFSNLLEKLRKRRDELDEAAKTRKS